MSYSSPFKITLLGRECAQCGEFKPWTSFHKSKRGTRGYHSYCKPCKLGNNRLYRYGLTDLEFEDIFRAQAGRCVLCAKPMIHRTAHVDHDHETGRIRGLLCKGCNAKLGWYENRKNLIEEYLHG